MGTGEDKADTSTIVSLPDVVNTTASEAESEETYLSIGLQVLLPFLVAGMGMVGAGIYLSHIQVNKCVPENFQNFMQLFTISSVLNQRLC